MIRASVTAGAIALICVMYCASPATARRSQHASNAQPHARSMTYLIAHVNEVLDRKCRAHFPSSWSRKVWIRRHRIAHKMDKGTCLPAHDQLWECIHRGEGSWSDTGDPYWGGLQMHPGWGGVYHASDLSALGQKWLAERELSKIPYSKRSSWIAGQWPVSHLACTQYY